MTRHDLLALARNLHRYRTAYDLLADAWNESLPKDLREAIGQNELDPLVRWLASKGDELSRRLHQAAMEEDPTP